MANLTPNIQRRSCTGLYVLEKAQRSALRRLSAACVLEPLGFATAAFGRTQLIAVGEAYMW